MGFERYLQHSGWNAFKNKDPAEKPDMFSDADNAWGSHWGYSSRPDRFYFSSNVGRTIVSAIYNRIAVDVASTRIEHVYLDDAGRFLDKVPSGLQYCLTQSANVDQTGRDLIIDAVESMLDEGVVAIVPIDTTLDPDVTGSYDIITMRVGKILQWYPKYIQVRVYNEMDGEKHDIFMDKKYVAIVQNPFYTIMNESNSLLRRLNAKLAQLDRLDDQNYSGKLNLILQMPYTIKTSSMREKANTRIQNLEDQLATSRHGIGYIDATEKITQINRPIDSNLVEEVQALTKQLFDQLGLTDAILNGTADGQTMKNYYVRSIDPILDSLTKEMARKFLTKTARTQGQSIEYYREPFTFMPTSEVAEVADKFMRNEIMSANELRSAIGFKPNLRDPKADQLSNPNIAPVNKAVDDGTTEEVMTNYE